MSETEKKLTTSRERSLANLKMFKPGQSGNPKGRPKKQKDVVEKAESYAVEAVETLAKLMKSEDEKVALAAAEQVLDRAIGKTKQTTESVNVNHNVNSEASEPVSDTAQFIQDALGAGTDSKDQEPLH